MTAQTISQQVQAGLDARTNAPAPRHLRAVPLQEPAAEAARSPWMDVREAAAYTGFSKAALDSMRYEQRGPAYSKPAGRVRYHRDDLDRFMREGRVSA